MDVICEHCGTKLSVPDEKIPKDQLVRISCPKCKNKISIDSRKASGAEARDADNFSETGKLHLKFIEQNREKNEEGSYSYEDFSDDESLDLFDENVKLALALSSNPDESAKIKDAVEKLGYKYTESPTTRDALGKMRFYHFDLVFLSDGFDGQEINNSPVMNYLNHVSMSSRRKIFLALIGDKFKTLDEMMAFALSANTVINSKDTDKLYPVLKKGLADNEKFYKVFMDTITATGKA